MAAHQVCIYCYIWLVTVINVSDGQSPSTHTICNNNIVTVTPASSGIIRHQKRDSALPGECSLTLRGFTDSSSVSLPGVDVFDNLCPVPITINNVEYCAATGVISSTNKVIIQLTTDELTISVQWDNSTSFTIEYYSQGKTNTSELLV